MSYWNSLSSVLLHQLERIYIIWIAKFKSIVTIQHNFLCIYGTEPPTAKANYYWFTQISETGSILKQKSLRYTGFR